MRTIYCDGSGNTEVCITCVYAEDYQDGKKGFLRLESFFNITNNEAEFLAVLRALEMTQGERPIKIITDSKLVVESINGNWNLRKPQLVELMGKCINISLGAEFEWYPREENRAGIILERYSKSHNFKRYIKFLDATGCKEFTDPRVVISFHPS